MNEGNETIVYADAQAGIYTTNKGLIGKLKRLNVKLTKENEVGAWFALTGCQIVIEVPKQRGEGVKRLELI